MSSEPLVTFERDADIAIIGFNRPEKRNAISDSVIEALDEAITRAEKEARAAVIHGTGTHFCAGLDLAEHAERSQIEGIHNSRRWHQVFDRIQLGAIPWFAALHGAVVGGGLEVAASVHVRVADDTAVFALPEGQRGIFVGGSGSVRVARLMGLAAMTDLMLTGRVLDADEAFRLNVFQYRVPAGTALEKARELAKRAATNAPVSNYAVIQALPRIQDMSQSDGLFVESLMASIASATPEAQAGLRAFLEGRAERLVPKGKD